MSEDNNLSKDIEFIKNLTREIVKDEPYSQWRETDQIHAMKAFENIMLMDTKNAAFFVNDLAKLINQAADFEKKENS